MDLTTIVCEYIYGAFVIIKTAVEALLDVFEVAIEKLYTLAMTINNVIFTTLGKALDAILLIITNALNALISAMNEGGGGWSFCAPAFGCNFFLEQILDPNSLIAKTIRKIFDGKDDCFCRKDKNGNVVTTTISESDKNKAIYEFQQTLYDIATDYENFKTQICNGLSFDLATDMSIDLCLGYLGQLNGWRDKIASKIKSLKKKLQGLIDMFKASGLFDLLKQIEAFFECVLDTELCANVDTAKSFYNYVLSKLGLIKAGAEEFILSPNIENEILGTANSFLSKINEAVKKVEGILANLSASASMKGASNALDLTSTIKGVGSVINDAAHGREVDWNKIPIIDYTNKKIEDLNAAYDRLHEKSTTNPEEALKNNKCHTLNDVILETLAEDDGSAVEYLDVEPGTDTSHANELLQVGDKFYTVADAAKQLYTGEGDPALINYCRTIGGFLNVDDIVTRY